ncbi:MAG: DUF899 family protein [Fimbriimonadaceae bacterium]
MLREKEKEIGKKIMELKQELAKAREAEPLVPIQDYELLTAQGPKPLSSFFGEHDDMILIHNMGKACSYCTLWADGLNAYLPHLSRRAAVLFVSPDDPATMAETAKFRGWNFTMATDATHEMTDELGFWVEGGADPGVSALVRKGDGVMHKNSTYFGPGDDFCAVWPLLELLDGGAEGWEPREANEPA